MEKLERNPLTVTIIALISILVVLVVVHNTGMAQFRAILEESILVFLPLAGLLLELLGGIVIVFGSVITFMWFVKAKLKNPYQPSGVIPYYARYLTLSLEFFIGAEIIKTAIAKTWDEFLLLILIIAGRGILGLILHFESKWSKVEENPKLG